MTSHRKKILAVMADADKHGVKFSSYIANGNPSMVVQGHDMPPSIRKAIQAYFPQIAAISLEKQNEKKEYERAVKRAGRVGVSDLEIQNLEHLESRNELIQIAKDHLVSSVKAAGGSISAIKQPDGSLNLLIVGSLDDRLFRFCDQYHAEIAALLHSENCAADDAGSGKV